MIGWPNTWEQVNSVAQIAALVVGGWWALKRFGLTRESRTFLDLSASARVVDSDDDSALVVITVQMKNIGSARIDAKTERKSDGSIFNDRYDHCLHAATLKVRRIPDEARQDGSAELDFWLEPNTTYDASVSLRLAKGNYAVKTFFIGALDAPREQEYWSHVAVFHCDAPASPQ